METNISVADVRLNPKGHYNKSIIIRNNTGTLIVDKDLFVISFAESKQEERISIINEYSKCKLEL